MINAANDSIEDAIHVGITPYGISTSPDGSKVYVANNGSGNVSIINTSVDTVLATVAVGGSPVGISVSPDGTKVYVANQHDTTVSVINTATNTVSDTIPVGDEPDAFGNFISIYTSTAGIATLSAEEESVSIYPNPFTTETTITFQEEQKNTVLKVMDILGNTIQQATLNTKQYSLNMVGFAKDIYFVEIIDENKSVINRKIVVE